MESNVRYDVGEGFTAISGDVESLLEGLPANPVEICSVAQGLIVDPILAGGFGIPAERFDERSIRSASEILRLLKTHDDRTIDQERPFTSRVVGTCRNFAVMACALMRYRGIPARCRAGFASYFVEDKFVDHWVIEYREPVQNRWVRVDPEILGLEYVPNPADLAEGEFLTGGEAWMKCRRGLADPMSFGVDGFPDNCGIGEIRGNLIRDLAALNKVETLPWDEWGRMAASYAGETGGDFDELMDLVAHTCASDDEKAIVAMYASHDFVVPANLT